jgi:hypothetical protein
MGPIQPPVDSAPPGTPPDSTLRVRSLRTKRFRSLMHSSSTSIWSCKIPPWDTRAWGEPAGVEMHRGNNLTNCASNVRSAIGRSNSTSTPHRSRRGEGKHGRSRVPRTRRLLHLAQHERAHLAGRVLLAVHLQPRVSVAGLDDLVGHHLGLLLHLLVVERAAHQPLGRVHSARGVGHRLRDKNNHIEPAVSANQHLYWGERVDLVGAHGRWSK